MIKKYTNGAMEFNFDNGEVVRILFIDNTAIIMNNGVSMRLGADAFADYLYMIATRFDPSKWKCTACGKKGTLYLRRTNVTSYRKVTNICEHEILTDENTIIIHKEEGQFGGYACGACGIGVASSTQELIEKYGGLSGQ